MKKVMKCFIVDLIVISLSPAGMTSQISPGGFSCSTLMLKHGSEQIFAHNLDMQTIIKGVVVVNKRNVSKEGRSWDELTSSDKRTTPQNNVDLEIRLDNGQSHNQGISGRRHERSRIMYLGNGFWENEILGKRFTPQAFYGSVDPVRA
jgi:hypothetical protein